MIAQTVHTAGVNWASVAAITGIVTGVVAVVGWTIRSTLGKTLSNLTNRINGHDFVLETLNSTSTDTRLSVARIEGYLAAVNGGGTTLPANATSDDLARRLPEVNLPTQREGVAP